MIPLSWQTLLARKASLAGSFVALALSVGFLGAMALTLASAAGGHSAQPRWFSRPDVVVAGTDTVTITSASGGDRETQTVRTGESRAVPGIVASRLAGLSLPGGPGAAMVTDYAGYASAAGAPGTAMHPWQAAALHRYTWLSGGPPRGAGQVVLTGPASYRPGQPITVQTAAGPRRLTVSGVIRTRAQPAFYAAGGVAARLAGGRISAIALTARPGTAVPALAALARADIRGLPVRVLTGDGRSAAEPDPDAGLFAVAAALLGSTSGVAGFVSVFVVAGTFAYSVAARRRELGLLRAVGATPRQVRRLVLGEALAIGAAGSLAGCVLAPQIAGPFARWLARIGFAPAGFTARFIWWPLAAALGAGMIIALAGALAAARRAGRMRPAEALREAAADRRVMTPVRWLAGLAALGAAVPLIMVFGGLRSAGAAALLLPIAMLLIIGCAMLLPAVLRPLISLVASPLRITGGVTGVLARHGAVTAVRRTVAIMTPVLLTVGFAGSLLSGFGTITGARQGAAASRIAAPAVVTARHGTGLADATVAAIRAVPGVTAAVPVTDTTVYVRSSGDPEDWTGEYLPGPRAARALRLPLVAGRLADLRGTGTVAVPAGRWRLGQLVQLWLADSAPVRLRVVAVYASQLDLADTVLLPWDLRAAHTSAPLASSVYLRLRPGASLAGVRAAARAGGGTVTATSRYLAAGDTENDRVNHLAVLVLLGMALLYTGIAIANTLVMAVSDRRRELAVLRLSGATARQVLRVLATEACLVTGAGIVLSAVVTAVTVASVRGGLAWAAPSVPTVIPWLPIGGIAVACLMIAVLATVIPAAITLRGRPAELAGLA